MESLERLKLLTEYKHWANQRTFSAISELPDGEAVRQRQTRFGNMVHTLNHVYVIDDIFKCHLLSSPHNYSTRNTESHPPLSTLWEQQKAMDKWYIDYVQSLSKDKLSEIVEFEFVDGGQGSMSRADIISHIVNHGTYHRGFIADMMYQVPATLPANDFPVYLRELEKHNKVDL